MIRSPPHPPSQNFLVTFLSYPKDFKLIPLSLSLSKFFFPSLPAPDWLLLLTHKEFVRWMVDELLSPWILSFSILYLSLHEFLFFPFFSTWNFLILIRSQNHKIFSKLILDSLFHSLWSLFASFFHYLPLSLFSFFTSVSLTFSTTADFIVLSLFLSIHLLISSFTSWLYPTFFLPHSSFGLFFHSFTLLFQFLSLPLWPKNLWKGKRRKKKKKEGEEDH